VAAEDHQRFLTAFVAASQTGDVAMLEQLFVEDAVSHSDDSAVCASECPTLSRHCVA
jgi:RNA polymerase sigma-70 factor (ECF subfamily)